LDIIYGIVNYVFKNHINFLNAQKTMNIELFQQWIFFQRNKNKCRAEAKNNFKLYLLGAEYLPHALFHLNSSSKKCGMQ
jgi:hypothetical protein